MLGSGTAGFNPATVPGSQNGALPHLLLNSEFAGWEHCAWVMGLEEHIRWDLM